jgi:ABC-2 type transport system ATP-binding protein
MEIRTAKAIEVSGLSRRFGEIVAVDRVSFDVEPGEIFGLVGPDGAGKTTTLRMLAGVLPPDSGAAQVAGYDVVRDPEGAKNQLSYMPQRFGLYEDLTVDENIRFYADLFGVRRENLEPRAGRLLEAAGMSEFRKRLAGKLSGGMKQKLGLVTALIHTPKVILLDEPTTGVDPVSRRDLWRILYSLLNEGVAILTATAYLDEAERCHRVALMHEGRMLFSNTPARLKELLPRGTLVGVFSPDARAARDALAGANGVHGMLLAGDKVHIGVDDGPRRIPELRARLAASGVPAEEIRVIEPTLEDIFVAAVEGKATQETR